MIKASTDYAGATRVVRELYGSPEPVAPAPAATRTINLETVSLLERPSAFRYRGRRYRIRALGWWDGIQLEYHRDEVMRIMGLPMTAEGLRALERHFVLAYAILWRYTRPRLWWLFRPMNPFLRCTTGEFLAIASFFYECQMQQPNLALGITGTPPRTRRASRTISQTRSHNLSKPSPRGPSTASPPPTTTTALGSVGLT